MFKNQMTRSAHHSLTERMRPVIIMLVERQSKLLNEIHSHLLKNECVELLEPVMHLVNAANKASRFDLDVAFWGLGGNRRACMTVLSQMQRKYPSVKCVVYSAGEEIDFVHEALRAGASGYIRDTSPVNRQISAIGRVASVGTYVDCPRVRCSKSDAALLKLEPARVRSGKSTNCDFQRHPKPSAGEVAIPTKLRGADGLAERAMIFIRVNLSPRLKVKTVARTLNSHPSDLERAFRRVYGITVKKHIDISCRELILNRIRLEGCKGYALAREYGFKRDEAFYRWIRRVSGIRFRELSGQYRPRSEKK
jgi:DNA-binding NarL/FixJ family response regulator/AraC-like DNA-binding protein